MKVDVLPKSQPASSDIDARALRGTVGREKTSDESEGFQDLLASTLFAPSPLPEVRQAEADSPSAEPSSGEERSLQVYTAVAADRFDSDQARAVDRLYGTGIVVAAGDGVPVPPGLINFEAIISVVSGESLPDASTLSISLPAQPGKSSAESMAEELTAILNAEPESDSDPAFLTLSDTLETAATPADESSIDSSNQLASATNGAVADDLLSRGESDGKTWETPTFTSILPKTAPAHTDTGDAGADSSSLPSSEPTNAVEPPTTAMAWSPEPTLVSSSTTGMAAVTAPLTSQVVTALSTVVASASGEVPGALTLRLDPPELGEVDVQFRRSVDGLVIRVTAKENVTMEMLLSRGAEIEKILKAQDADIVSVEFATAELDVDGRSGADSGAGQGRGRGAEQERSESRVGFGQSAQNRSEDIGGRGRRREAGSRIRIRA
ncbi:MAG: flagellar hook-length control protein FliK [Fuerstiella sp.]